MGQLFGTDGIRGVANRGLDASLAYEVGRAAAAVLAKGKSGAPLFVIGKDTRISSDMLEASLISGICSAGGDVISLGVISTPAVAFATMKASADAGIVISASHNPFRYNGIKIFDGSGFKLSDELELEIERIVLESIPVKNAEGADIGQLRRGRQALMDAYIEYIASFGENISGLKVLIDCANGAASVTAEKIFSRFDIDLTVICDKPDGLNINDQCGSTNMKKLARLVVEGGYNIGIAFDGDADRCLAVDEKGHEVDGDRIMAICGCDMKKKGKLKNDFIVATVMSNIGFKLYAAERGIELRCAAVGDRNVLEMMQKIGANIGGEQSGHLIFLDDSTTGDGQLAAIKILNILSGTERTLSQLAEEIVQYPQKLINVPVADNEQKDAVISSKELSDAVKKAEAALGDKGRVLIRPSGTEALIRVMVEAFDKEATERLAAELADLIRALVKN